MWKAFMIELGAYLVAPGQRYPLNFRLHMSLLSVVGEKNL